MWDAGMNAILAGVRQWLGRQAERQYLPVQGQRQGCVLRMEDACCVHYTALAWASCASWTASQPPTHPPAHLPTADEMGLGKTLQTISLLSYLKFERGVQVSSRHDGLHNVGNWQMPIQEQRIAAGWGMFAGSWFALQLLILHMRACLCRRARTWWLCRSACCPAGSASSSDGVRRRAAGWRAAKL